MTDIDHTRLLTPADTDLIEQVTPNGFYTVVVNDQYITLRVTTIPKGKYAKGTQSISYRDGRGGPADASSYRWCAYVQGSNYRLGYDFRNATMLEEAIFTLLSNDPEPFGQAWADVFPGETAPCWMCGLPLIDPQSLSDRVGPVCIKKLNKAKTKIRTVKKIKVEAPVYTRPRFAPLDPGELALAERDEQFEDLQDAWAARTERIDRPIAVPFPPRTTTFARPTFATVSA